MLPKPFYITTAINYTNGNPHSGHAYEAIVADCLARYHRLAKYDVFFMTGSDEHGQKIADTASQQKLDPIQLCDLYVEGFKKLNSMLSISNDFYIRTTTEEHKICAQVIWQKVKEKGDIYLGTYDGWYNKREERFMTEIEAKNVNYMDGDIKLIKMSEPSYFFKLSKYQDKLIDYLKRYPEYIFPEERYNEIMERLKEPLLDLSISRTNFDWGIKVPNDENHVMYVWFDALTNYLSGVEYHKDNNKFNQYWPASMHVIGKDIVWFHAVIWSCMLFSLDLPLPKNIVCHGFINGPDGRKMSKSWGNVICPKEMLTRYTSDTLRYFVLREGVFGADFNFSETGLIDRYNSDLANGIGNFVQRCLTFVVTYCDSKIPMEQATHLFDVGDWVGNINKSFGTFQIQSVIQQIMEVLANVNKWLNGMALWNLKNQEDQTKRNIIVRTLLEFLYVLTHLMECFIPEASSKIFERLNTKPVDLRTLVDNSWDNLKPGTVVSSGAVLFPRIGLNRQDKKTVKK